MKSPSAGRVVQNLKRYRGVRYRVAKITSGNNVPYPNPWMDWEAIRLAKMKCLECGCFDVLLGGCVFARLPNECERIVTIATLPLVKDKELEYRRGNV